MGWGARPLLLAVESEPERLARTETELARGFGATFRVRGELSGADAVRVLEGAGRRAERVALILVDESLPADQRQELLETARRLHPEARRTLLVRWGAWADPEVSQLILQGMEIGDLHSYVLRPWVEGDELFHRTVAEFVQDWSRTIPGTSVKWSSSPTAAPDAASR